LTGQRGLRKLSHSDLLNHADVAQAVDIYAQAVIDTEWMNDSNRRGSEKGEAALQNLRKAVIRLDRDVPPALQSYVLHLLDELVRSRQERLWLSSQPQKYKIWGVILLLGLLSHLAIVVVHLDKPKACKLSLYLFCIATRLAYWLLLNADDPYQTFSSLDPKVLLK
jgi:hypothetical protein